MQYIDENDWVTYVLLVLLPPLGIYLLWRRGRFDKIMRIGISVASALWFALLIFLIVSLISSGMNDPNRPVEGPTIRPVTPTPTVSALPSASVAPSGGVLPTASALPGVDEGIIDAPTATPLTGTGTAMPPAANMCGRAIPAFTTTATATVRSWATIRPSTSVWRSLNAAASRPAPPATISRSTT